MRKNKCVPFIHVPFIQNICIIDGTAAADLLDLNENPALLTKLEELFPRSEDWDVRGSEINRILYGDAEYVDGKRVPSTQQAIELIHKQANEVDKERVKVPFVNEFASDEDIEKYSLNEIWDMYHPLWKGDYYIGRKPDFTIDRQRNIFFMIIGGGGEEHQNRKKCLLWLSGQHVVIEVDLAVGSSANINDVPYKIIWKLVGIYPQVDAAVPQEEIIMLLKEALTTYGLLGVYRQVPNTIVEFVF